MEELDVKHMPHYMEHGHQQMLSIAKVPIHEMETH